MNSFDEFVNPYPGLRPFREEDAGFFFGRNREFRSLLDKLSFHRFVAVVGSSGCGKSSLVRAALLPALRAGYDSDFHGGWRIAVFTPGENPFNRLARVLAETLAGDIGGFESVVEGIEADLRNGEEGLKRLFSRANLEKGTKIFILADQFEELFTVAAKSKNIARSDVREFVQFLIEAKDFDSPQVFVMITMRSENLGMCSRYGELAQVINDGLFLVPVMGRENLREVVELPVDCNIEYSLVNRLLNSLVGSQDDLPLLQHALMRIWDARLTRDRESDLSLCDLDQVGNVGETIANQVEKEILPCFVEDEVESLFELLLSIVEVGSDGQMNRQPKRFGDLLAVSGVERDRAEKLLEPFRKDGKSFVLPPISESDRLRDSDMIDISHESFIRSWPTLKMRAEKRRQEREVAEWYNQAALRWENDGRPDEGLSRNLNQLQRALDSSQVLGNNYNDQAIAFVHASLERIRSEADRRTREIEARRRNKIILWSSIFLLAICGLVSILLIRIDAARSQAAASKALAEAAESQAEKANALAETERARAEVALAQAARERTEKLAAEATAKAESIARELTEAKNRIAENEAAKRNEDNANRLEAEKLQQERIEAEKQLELARSENEAIGAEMREKLAALARSAAVVNYKAQVSSRDSRIVERRMQFYSDRVSYLGEGILTQNELLEQLRAEAAIWEKREFSFVIPIADEDAVNTEKGYRFDSYLFYEYRRKNFGSRSKVWAGFVKESVEFEVESGVQPKLISITREAVGRDVIEGLVQDEINRRNLDLVSLENQTVLGNLYFWLHCCLSDLSAIRSPVSTGLNHSSDKIEASGVIVESGDSGVPVSLEVKFSPVENDYSWSTSKFGESRVEVDDDTFPWLLDQNALLSMGFTEAARMLTPETWEAEGDMDFMGEEEMRGLAENALQLYLIAGNPEPDTEVKQIDFFDENRNVTSYYGSEDVSYSTIEEGFEDYARKYPERNFSIISSPRVEDLVPGSNGFTATVTAGFDVTRYPGASPVEIEVTATFEFSEGSFPEIIAIGSGQ